MSTPPAPVPDRAASEKASRMARWAHKGVWTVLDQGLFAGANFAINVLLARWLSPEAYGAFTVAFIVFLLVGTVHGGLLIEPMLVFGAGRFEGKTGRYLRVLLGEHLKYAAISGAVLASVGGVALGVGSVDLGAAFLALSVAQGFILMLWLLRRACYVVSKPSWAVGAGALYLAILLAGAFALDAQGWLTGPVAYGLMAFGSLAASVLLAIRLGVPASSRGTAGLHADARQSHVRYGRWAAPAGILEWAHGALPFLVLPLFVGLEGSGTLRALYNLAMPALQAFSALATMALPVFVRAYGRGELRSVSAQVGGAFVGLAVAYGAFILFAGPWFVTWLYDGQYGVGRLALVLLAVVPVVAAVAGILMAILRAQERPEAVFVGRAWAVGAAATVGTALTAMLGVAGALASDLVALVTESAVLSRALRSREPAPPLPTPPVVSV